MRYDKWDTPLLKVVLAGWHVRLRRSRCRLYPKFRRAPGQGVPFLAAPTRAATDLSIASRVRGTWRYESPPGSIYVRRLYHRCSFAERGPCSLGILRFCGYQCLSPCHGFSPSYERAVLRVCSFCCPLPLGFGLYPRAANPSIRTFVSSNGPGVQPISHLLDG